MSRYVAVGIGDVDENNRMESQSGTTSLFKVQVILRPSVVSHYVSISHLLFKSP